MENFRQYKVEFSYNEKFHGLGIEKVKELEKYINSLNKLFKKDNQNFADLLIYVYKVKQLFSSYQANWVYDKNHKQLRFRDIMNGFGLDETQVSRLLACYDKYIYWNPDKQDNDGIIYIFQDFSKSKLFELLPVPNLVIKSDLEKKVISSDMSVAQIRQYVKNYKAQQKANSKLNEDPQEDKPKDIEEEIPMAYDPKKEYEFSYFETKTKSQLLNMIWDLQKEYQKLKKEKNKK